MATELRQPTSVAWHHDRTAPLHLDGAARTSRVVAKRTMDLVLAALLVAVLTPLMLLIAALIRMDSRGPALYRQERVGARRARGGKGWVWEVRHFHVTKFRTMHAHTDDARHQEYVRAFVEGRLSGGADHPTPFKLQRDPRVTRIGALLRRTSLDELPQLFNVVGGTMSLVGPRPVPPYEVGHYQPKHRARLAALPGITGQWQVEGRGHVTFEEMVQMDVDYIERQSVWLDLAILARTLPAVLSRRGAA